MRVVMVEDSALVREQLCLALAREHRVTLVGTATEEKEAIELILSLQPDAVLLDLCLAVGSGLRVLRAIRAAGCGSRILVLSNSTEAAMQSACAALGISGFYDKALDAGACLAQLFSWLPPLPRNEVQRLAALRALKLLGAPEDEAFDGLARMARDLLQVPVALVSLVDADRQWFAGRVGLDLQESSRSSSFCAHTILEAELMEVTDALQDQRFFDNPLVQGHPSIRFYAGVPLILSSGEALGTLCVIDHQQRRLSELERRTLKSMAHCVTSEIELRRRVLQLENEVERRKAAEMRIQHLATRDALTGLPNRTALMTALEQQLRLSSRHGDRLGLLFIDLDRFKLINDVLGHATGDAALMLTASRLSEALRDSDVVARLGGDEFVVLLPQLNSVDEGLLVANKLLAQLQRPAVLDGQELRLDASIGFASFPDHGRSSAELLRHADQAMYEAKKSGGAQPFMSWPELEDRSSGQLRLDQELRLALDDGDTQLQVHYQPQLSTDGTSLEAVEALVRWEHPRLGMLPPSEFISLAEERGLIATLGERVLDMSLRQLVAWDREGLHVPSVAVNVSPLELARGYVDKVGAALRRHGLPASRLELEITESTLTSDGVDTHAMLAELRSLGVRIAVDDFGVGYSSLSQLRRLPIDRLKIDRMFVHNMETSEQDRVIVAVILKMGMALGLSTIAEGVETPAQQQTLLSMGCPSVQGYLFSPPLPAAALSEWVQSRMTPALPAGSGREEALDESELFRGIERGRMAAAGDAGDQGPGAA